MNNYYQNNEMEIDLIGLCIYVFKQWRKLLVFFLVGAIIGCGVSYFKMTSFDPYDPAKVEQYFAKLKPDELDKEMIGQYADFNNLYDETCDRKEDSVILNMDSTLVYSGSLSYFVSSENDDIDEISAYYNSLFDRDDNWDRLLKASGLDCNEAAFKELAWVSFSKSALDNQIVSDTNVIEKRSASLSFGFTSPTKAARDAVLAEMEAMADECAKENAKNYKNFICFQTRCSTNEGYSSGVASSQAEYAGLKQSYLNQITTIGKNLSDDEKLYYAYNYNWDEYLENYKGGFSKKWPAIVAVVLAFLTAGWYAVKYIFDKSIKSEDEIERIFGLHILGSIDNSNYKNIFDKLFDKWGKAGLAPANDADYLRSVLAASSAQSIAIVCDTNDAEQDALARALAKDASKVCIAGNLAADASAVEAVESCTEAIYFAHINRTGKNTFAKYLETAERLNKKSAGVVVIR